MFGWARRPNPTEEDANVEVTPDTFMVGLKIADYGRTNDLLVEPLHSLSKHQSLLFEVRYRDEREGWFQVA